MHCSLSPGYNYERKGFYRFKGFSSKREEMLSEARVQQDRRKPLFSSSPRFPVGVALRPTPKNLGFSRDEHSLWLAKWEHEFHNSIQRTRLRAAVRTIQEGFGSEMGTGWMTGHSKWHLPPKWHLVKSNVYSKAFYHLVTKDFKINTEFLFKQKWKKEKKKNHSTNFLARL